MFKTMNLIAFYIVCHQQLGAHILYSNVSVTRLKAKVVLGGILCGGVASYTIVTTVAHLSYTELLFC